MPPHCGRMENVMNARINIFCGHFGSGKTEVSLNYALKLAGEGKKVTIIDLDIVNPYFRTADAKKILNEHGIELIASEFANSNLDMPTVPQEIKKVFCSKESHVIFDVGGDEDGAYALGQYKDFFENEPYRMVFVVSTKRPMTKTCDELFELAQNIEYASRLKFTDIANNTNLGKLTDENTLLSDYDEIKALSEKMGVPVTMQCGLEKSLSKLPQEFDYLKFPMKIYIKMPWEL